MTITEDLRQALRPAWPDLRLRRRLDLPAPAGDAVTIACPNPATLHLHLPQQDEAVTEITLPPGASAEALAQALQAILPRLVADRYRAALDHVKSANEVLLSSLEPEEIIRNVVQLAISVIPESDSGVFRIYDAAQDQLVPVSQIGFGENYLTHLYRPNESISGIAFETRRPVVLRSRDAILNAPRNLPPEKMDYLRRGPVANSLVCMPVQTAERCLGTLTLLNFRQEAAFSPFGLTVLEIFASQLAIAWQNAQAHHAALASLHMQRDLRSALEVRNRDLSDALSIHHDMLAIFGGPGGLDDKLRSVADRFDLRFAYADLFGTRHPAAPSPPLQEFLHNGTFPPTPPGAPAPCPVRLADQEVGILLPQDDSPLTRIRIGILAAFIALEIRKEISRDEVTNRRKRALFNDLVAGPGPEITADLARHRFALRRFCQIAALRLPDGVGDVDVTLLQALSRITRQIGMANLLSFYDDAGLVLLMSADSAATLRDACTRLAALMPQMRACCGTSAVYDDTAHALHLRNARESAEILRMQQEFGLLSYDRIGVERLLIHQPRDQIAKFVYDTLGPDLSDGSRPDRLLITLSTFVAKNRAAGETARELGIHTNTLYQRLHRIEELTGLSTSDAEGFMMLSLACHLKRVYAL